MELAAIKGRLTPVEEGVKNFNSFQKDVRGKIAFVFGATWFAGIVGTILLSILAWFFTQVFYPAVRLIMDDYYHRHPSAEIQQKSDATQPPPVYAVDKQPPQTAVNPPPIE